KHASSLTKAAEIDLSRYREEIELLTWMADAGVAAGCFPTTRRDYGLVSNTIASEFADRLAGGDVEGAARLATFARDNVPDFRWSARDIAMRQAQRFGRYGGRVLVWLRQRYLRICIGGA